MYRIRTPVAPRKHPGLCARLVSGHRYFDVERWESPDTMIVHFYGHTDEPPVVCFDLLYQVKLGGTPTRLYQNLPLGGRVYCPLLLGPAPYFVQ